MEDNWQERLNKLREEESKDKFKAEEVDYVEIYEMLERLKLGFSV
jgi:hypothetical protein